MSALSLSELCIQTLVLNKERVAEIRNIPFRLIKPYLRRINIQTQQLLKLERCSPSWLFDDEEFWVDYLKIDFPTNVQEQYTMNRQNIIKYYFDTLRESDIEMNDKMRERVRKQLRREPKNQNKYKVPSRMLYLQYQKDLARKEELLTEKLRMQMQEMKAKREENQTVAVGETFYINNIKKSSSSRSKSSTLRYQNWNKKNENDKETFPRRQVDRVAFGGMAGRRLDSNTIKVVSTNSVSRGASLIGKPSSTTNNVTRSVERLPPAPVSPQRSSRKRHAQDTDQNIFLSRKRPTRRIRQDSNPPPVASSSSSSFNDTKSVVKGTKKRQSSIFNRSLQAEPQPERAVQCAPPSSSDQQGSTHPKRVKSLELYLKEKTTHRPT